ncbi:MAG: hypothetical protein RIS35_2432, partial [Pseudomonadota bacterium]
TAVSGARAVDGAGMGSAASAFEEAGKPGTA